MNSLAGVPLVLRFFQEMLMLNFRSLNQVNLVGKVGSVQLRQGQGKSFLTLSVATDSLIKDGNQWSTKTEWHNIVFFGNNAQKLSEQITKGCTVIVTGGLSYKKTEKGMFCSIVAEQLQLVGVARTAEQSKQQYQPQPRQSQPKQSSEPFYDDKELF